jgi:hypothetical protein
MDEQHILDGIERKLADENPRLASSLSRFGEPRLSSLFGSGKTRVAAVAVSLVLAALMALMVYSMRPYAAGQSGVPPRTRPSPSTAASHVRAATSSSGPSAGPASG